MLRTFAVLIIAPLVFAKSLPSFAGVADDIPSCYVASKLKPPRPDREFFVLVDQTTILDAGLKNSVIENVGRLVSPGTAIVIGTFSSYSQGRYFEIITAGAIERPLPVKSRDSIGVKVLHNFDKCMQDQLGFARNLFATALGKALGGSSPDLARSDIMSSLMQLSVRVKESSASEKIVFVVSDMLEHSAITSFYSMRNVRHIDPSKELRIAQDAQQIGDFAGAKIFVLGGGLLQEKAGNAGQDKSGSIYRDPKAMGALKEFWDHYFQKSNARLIEFGTPTLKTPLN